MWLYARVHLGMQRRSHRGSWRLASPPQPERASSLTHASLFICRIRTIGSETATTCGCRSTTGPTRARSRSTRAPPRSPRSAEQAIHLSVSLSLYDAVSLSGLHSYSNERRSWRCSRAWTRLRRSGSTACPWARPTTCSAATCSTSRPPCALAPTPSRSPSRTPVRGCAPPLGRPSDLHR